MGWGGGGSQSAKQQAMFKDAKNHRENDYFWDTQQRIGTQPPAALAGWALQQEEKELFKAHTGNVGIDFNKYDDIDVEMSGEGAEEIQPITLFNDLFDSYELPDFLWQNIERCKYSRPTPVQRYAMPAALAGRDVMVCAQTGSGKTCAFLVPILSCIDPNQATGLTGVTVGQAAAPKAVVMAPTRELCAQIHMEARKLSFSSHVRCSEVYGGVDAKPQLRELALGSDIVTATPGRLNDFIQRGVMSMAACGYLVLDEADRMLDMGFEPQIREIVQKYDMPQPADGRMTLMFSATFPKEIQKLAMSFMRNYIWVGVGRVGGACDTVEQNFIVTSGPWQKEEELQKLLRASPNDSTLVFVAMKRTAAELESKLKRQGIGSAPIHGDMEQREREWSLNQFRNGQVKVLVATDVAARGLDIPAVSHVVNYDLPANIEDYVHRIGRTGRIGNRGWATSMFNPGGHNGNLGILGKLMETLEDAGKEVPHELAQIAQQNGIYSGSKGGKKKKQWGGNDHRGGKVHSWKVSGAGGNAAGRAGGAKQQVPAMAQWAAAKGGGKGAAARYNPW